MLGSIIGAVGSLAGGLLGASNAKKQMAMQKEFAQNQLQWKAADAEKAGISKYFAMGAPTANYSPVNVGDYGLADAASKLGAGIDSQGQKAGATTTGKVSGISAAIANAQLDGLRIDNDIKRAELASKVAIATQPGAGHGMDRDVVLGPEGYKTELKKAPAGYLPQKEFGVAPEVSMYRTKEGYAPQIPQQLQEAFESDMLSRWQWNIRNKILPGFGQWGIDQFGTPPFKAGPGEWWDFDPVRGEYRLRTGKRYYER